VIGYIAVIKYLIKRKRFQIFYSTHYLHILTIFNN